jgi:voltage-gated potassium channel Kch
MSETRSSAPLVERRARKIAHGRHVTFGLSLTFIVLALIGAVVVWLVDSKDFPSFGLAVWWALQTVTTVGYGDVTPTTTTGRVVGGIEMVFGISLISLLTAAVTSTVIERGREDAHEQTRVQLKQNADQVLTELAEIRKLIGGGDAPSTDDP